MVDRAQAGLPANLAKDVQSLFWEVDASTLDVSAHREYILGRVLEYGTTRV